MTNMIMETEALFIIFTTLTTDFDIKFSKYLEVGPVLKAPDALLLR
jgi:hypothetical protein